MAVQTSREPYVLYQTDNNQCVLIELQFPSVMDFLSNSRFSIKEAFALVSLLYLEVSFLQLSDLKPLNP